MIYVTNKTAIKGQGYLKDKIEIKLVFLFDVDLVLCLSYFFYYYFACAAKEDTHEILVKHLPFSKKPLDDECAIKKDRNPLIELSKTFF